MNTINSCTWGPGAPSLEELRRYGVAVVAVELRTPRRPIAPRRRPRAARAGEPKASAVIAIVLLGLLACAGWLGFAQQRGWAGQLERAAAPAAGVVYHYANGEVIDGR